MNCPRCFVQARYSHNGNYYYHTCGWKMVAPPAEDAEIEPQKPIVSVEIPYEPKPPEPPQKRKMSQIALWNMGSRSEYFERHSLTEEDIQVDENGREFWTRERDGQDDLTDLEIVYVPTRFKKKKSL